MTESVDVVIVGAGLSGIGAAYRLQEHRPQDSYVVLEARDAIGGTWDLFRYPGVRSDSDMYTLGYAFKPWRDSASLADGSTILDYTRQTAREAGIDKHIRLSTAVVAADFDTTTRRWTVTLSTGGSITCRFLYACAGYYDYEVPHQLHLPGIEDFRGDVVHPQFWPEDDDYAGKRVVVIGSGATAVTLVPAMLNGPAPAAHVTMLQRTPTWMAAVPRVDRVAERLKSTLPPRLAHRLARGKSIAFNLAFYQYCRNFPVSARNLLSSNAARILGDDEVRRNFTPPYNPWDQRLCAIPGGDFFRAVRDQKAEVVTGLIGRIVPDGILLTTGQLLPADLIVTATGLRLKAFGGIAPTVDGRTVDLARQFAWNGAMITGVPNFAFCVGYTNSSWTLRADLTHRLVCKVLTWMDAHGYEAVVPQPSSRMEPQPLLDLESGYIRRDIEFFPHQGQRHPWRVRQNYLLDSLNILRTNLDATLVPVAPPTA